ncbi:putative drug/proton antiporter YHK8 [Candida viswanathii]|uniref:Putative drug/proton antiporter YHK8 n=1 Tax=Candida viswanathii TaxID=5486 RepID=A0A367XUJ1_9ASCO|nr:putative drug/proton antiporter YHK8 [Candida viswanathii]
MTDLQREKTKESAQEEPISDSIELSNPEEEEEEAEKDDKYRVKFDGLDDKEDASRLSRLHKWTIVGIISLGSVCVTCISSSVALAIPQMIEYFHVSHEVAVLNISFFILGLGTGGCFLSPISEFHGRRVVYIGGLLLMIAFQFLTAFSNNMGGVVFGRFMSGFFGLSYMSVASGSFADLFKANKKEGQDANKELSLALTLYSVAPFLGPSLGSLLSGFINTYLFFRWTFYVFIMWSGAMLLLVILFVPETYEPINLKRKAKRIRKATGDDRYYAPIEIEKATLYETILTSSRRPFMLLLRDNMTAVLNAYTAFTLAVVYLFFISFPYIFSTVYHFSISEQGCSFLGLVVGMVGMSLISPWFADRSYVALLKRNNGVGKPEFRFVPLMVGAFVVPIGLFIIGWTLYAASAMATNSFTRSVMSCVFPLFGLQMYEGMGIQWATTLLALVSVLLIPIPFLFFKYGEHLRSKSPYAWSTDY